MDKLPLSFEMPIGIKLGGKVLRSVTLAKTNGAAEQIFTERLPERPYTWMGYVIAAGVHTLGDIPVAAEARADFIENGSISLPEVVTAIPMPELNNLLVEIHRRIWRARVKNQECLCKYCGSKMITEIDLTRIDFTDEQKAVLAEEGRDWFQIVVNLSDGWTFVAPRLANGQESPLAGFDGAVFDRFTFRLPTLADAIRNEKHASDSVPFWRRIAYDCLTEVYSTTLGEALPAQAYKALGLKLYEQHLTGEDLGLIREALRDSTPTMPFMYEETCPKCKRLTPVALEGNSFFSE